MASFSCSLTCGSNASKDSKMSGRGSRASAQATRGCLQAQRPRLATRRNAQQRTKSREVPRNQDGGREWPFNESQYQPISIIYNSYNGRK